MKKLIVLVSALLLVSMVAIAADFSEITASGEVEQRWMQDFNNKAYADSPVIEWKMDVGVGDNATLYLEVEEGTSGTGLTLSPFDKAHFTLDLGGIYDLPVGVTVRTGWDEYDQFDAVKVTVGEYEDVIGSDAQEWGHEINIAASDMIALRVIWANDPAVEYFSAGVAVTYDPVYVEVSYVNIGDAFGTPEESGKGDVEAGLEFAMDVADGIAVAAAAAVDYDLESEATGDSAWLLGAAGAVTYNEMATLGVAFRGMTDSEVNSMQVDISAMPVEGIEVFLIAGLGLDDAIYADMFDSFEGSVKFAIGPSTWYAGMYWSAEGSGGIAREKSDFVDPGVDAMSFFMRAELKY